MNETIMRQLGFGDKVDLIKRGLCPSCKQPVGTFRDELSRREYGISGFCQACQDRTFDKYNDSEDEFDDYCDIDNPNGHPDRIKGNKL